MHCERNLFYKFSARLAASSGCDVHNYKPKTTKNLLVEGKMTLLVGDSYH